MDQYNSQQAGITAAIVLAILIPVGCCLVCLIIRLRQHAIEQRQMQQGQAGYNSVYKPTTQQGGHYSDDSQRGGFFNRFQRGGRRREGDYDSDSSAGDRKYPIGEAAAVHEGRVAQERETLQRDAAPAYSRSFDPGTESSAPSTPDSIKKIKQSRGSINRNSMGMSAHPDPLMGVSQKSLPREGGSRPGSRSNLMAELGGAGFMRKEDDLMVGRSSTLPPPPSDLLSQAPKGPTLASPPASISRPSTTSGTLKSAMKQNTSSSSSDDAGAAVMAAATAAMAGDMGSPVSPTFFDNKNPYTSTSSSNRSSAKGPRHKDVGRLAAVVAADLDSNSENTDSKYDAVYYTKEPLPRRDPVEFSDRSMDVDINMKAYRTHQARPSDL